MSSEPKFSTSMVDWLYDELSPEEAERFEQHLQSHPQDAAEVDALQATRSAFKELDEVEPPSLSAALLHEAAKHAKTAQAPEQVGLWARLLTRLMAFFEPIALHPGASAMATLIVVVGVAGLLYSRNGDIRVQSQVASRSEAPTEVRTEALEFTATVGAGAEAKIALKGEGRYARVADENNEKALIAGREQLDEEPEPAVEALVATNKEVADSSAEDVIGGIGTGSGVGKKRNKRGKNKRSTKLGKLESLSFGGPSGAKSDSSSVRLQTEARGMAQKGGVARKAPKKKAIIGRVANPDVTPVSPTSPPASGSWENQQSSNFRQAVQSNRCQDAGVIANNLLDRNPTYYRSAITSKTIGKCKPQIQVERKRRVLRKRQSRASSFDDDMDQAAPTPSEAPAQAN